MFDFLYISFFLKDKMLKNLSTKYHQKNKESLWKNTHESYEDFSKKEKEKKQYCCKQCKPTWIWKTKVGRV